MLLHFDLETVPGAAPYLFEEAENSTRPSAAMKKPETLLKWHEEERPGLVLENFRKFGLQPETGEIVSIAAVTDDDVEWVKCRVPGESEAGLLAEFFTWVAERQADRVQVLTDGTGRTWPVEPEGVHLVAHNAAFDVGFLRNRCIATNTKPSFRLPTGLDRPGKAYTCTMLAWSGYGRMVSMRRVALALGLPDPKGGLDGSQIFDAWQAGRIEEIAAYNLNDAKTVKQIFERMQTVEVAS